MSIVSKVTTENIRLVRSIIRIYVKSNTLLIKNSSSYHQQPRLIPLQRHNQIRYYTTGKENESKLPSTKLADLEEQRFELGLELQNTYKNQSMSPKIKASRLKAILFQLITVLPDAEFPHNQLPFINSVVNYIDQSPNPRNTFTTNEMMDLLRSVLGAMTLNDVRYIDFFPRFYNAMRESKEYETDEEIRLQLFEVFINYVLLSNKRDSVVKIVEAFVNEENDLRSNDVRSEIIEIVLEAFNTVKPDTGTVIALCRLCPDMNQNKVFVKLLETFFRAADEEISTGFEENCVSERLVTLLDIFEEKLGKPWEEYVEILYFATKNNFDDVSKGILGKLEKLTKNFENKEWRGKFEGDVLFALVTAALKFDKTLDAIQLIKGLKEIKKETQFIEEEWMAIAQLQAFELRESEPAINLVKHINKQLEGLEKDYAFEDTESYNLFIEALCWSEKSLSYIEQFKQDFEQEYGLQRDVKSVATVMDYLVKKGNPDLAAKEFLASKDLVDWENEYDGFYMLSLFKLTASVWQKDDISWAEKMEVYSKVQRYEFLFDKESIYILMTSAIKNDAAPFAIKVFLDQTPELKKEDPKLKVASYQKIFDCIYEYLIDNKDKELNKRVYKYISEFFEIPYDYYPGFVKMFIDCGDPDMALRVFADMKQLSKESKLPPPSEEFYIYLLKSFAKFQDADAIFKLHLAIKMDLSINLDIKLLNGLMEAYAALEDPFKTRDVFNLSFSLPKEHGMNNESCYWMIKSLKYATLGHVNDLYNGLSQYDVLPDANIFGEILIANCYFEQYRTALDTLIEAHNNGDDHLINAHVLKTMHNYCLHDGVKKDLDKYCTKNFPVVWKELKESGQLKNNTEYPDLLSSPYDKPTIEVKRIKS